MTRFAFASLLATLTALVAAQLDPQPVLAQEKGKGKAKAKDKAPAPPPTGEKEDFSRVLPVFDPGSHTQPISAMGFMKDAKKLVTVGQDFTVQVWSTATGERLDILRLPGYGREKGYDPGRWDVAAVSPDGTRIAVGGQVKLLSADGGDRTGRLILVDVVKRTVTRIQIRTGLNRPVTALAFSPDGNTLAMAIEKGPKEDAVLILVGDLSNREKNARPLLLTADCHQTALPTTATELAFSPDGKRLAVGGKQNKKLTLWDVPTGAAPQPKLVKELTLDTDTMGLGWSPDGKQFVHTLKDNEEGSRVRGFDIRTADGELVKAWRKDDLVPALTAKAFVTLFGVRFLDANTIYFVANGGSSEPAVGGGTIAGVLDLATGKARRLGIHPEGMVTVPAAAASADGKWVAYTVSGNTEAQVGSPDGKAFVRCGQRAPIPYYLGWSKDPAKPGFAWTAERTRPQIVERDPALLKFGFDLGRVEPVGAIDGANYDTARWTAGDWSIKFVGAGNKAPNDGFRGPLRLVQSGKPVAGLPGTNASARSLIPSGDGPPLVAVSNHVQYVGERTSVFKSDGTALTRLLPDANNVTDLVSSPDGRFVAATTGTPRIVIYRTDGSPYPLLSFAQLNGEWVIWTPEGYYAASPGGEKLFGWAINNGQNALVTFHPAEKYAQQFRRPDIIKLVIEKGSVAEALKALNAKPADLSQITASEAKLTLVEQRGATVTMKASASSGAKDKPIVAMRVLLDGRPLGDGKGVWTPVPGKPAEATFTFDVPTGKCELKLLVRTDDGATISDPLIVTGPKAPGSQPTLYRVCIGINEYDGSGLANLGVAAKDAQDLFAALGTYCVGPENRFGAAKGELILNKDATRDRVVKALGTLRKAKPGDLVVVSFAGHGYKQNDDFYLVTREGNIAKDLKGFSLSGDDLKKALEKVECPVLLILDACHAAKSVSSFPTPMYPDEPKVNRAVDDLTRKVTIPDVGITVLSAAMAHETAGATAENGYFTMGLLKGLKAGEGVPYDPYERQLYVHHLYSVAFSEVRRATNGKQNPFLNMPWTVPPMSLREVPTK